MRGPILVALALLACETPPDVKAAQVAAELATQQRDAARWERDHLASELEKLEEAIKERKIIIDGKTPQYLISIRVKQSHFSLDITKHMKNAINAFEMEIPVSKEFYDSVESGSSIVNKFRWGSLLMRGSIGKWKLKCIGKRIVEP